MTVQLHVGEELGIENCDFVAQGQSEGEVIEQVVAHLRSEHHLAMPDAVVILRDDALNFHDEAVQIIVRRLHSHLGLGTDHGRYHERDTPPPGIESGSPLNRG